ncbi:hypothetical protein EBU99_02340 [bacterium]|nr:hypothetical protein [bacterium]
MRQLLISPFVLVVACAPEPPTISKTNPSVASAEQGLSLIEKQRQALTKTLELKAQNDEMCLLVQKQRVECKVAGTSLRPDDSQTVLGCVSGVAKDAKLETTFEMDIQAPPGTRVYLTAQRGNWQTNSVPSGSKQKLTWIPRQTDKCSRLRIRPRSESNLLVRSPRIIELTDLNIIFEPNDCNDQRSFGKGDLSGFAFYINGEKVFGQGDLNNGTGTGAGAQVSVNKLLDYAQDPKCSVPDDVLKAAFEKGKANAAADIAAASSKAPPATIEDDLARETNRNEQMRRQLKGNENIGCWGYEKIEKLEVKVEGAALPNANRGDSRSALQSLGNSKEYTFSFGQNMKFSIPDESARAVFKPGGGFVLADFKEREIQELRNIRISKGGVAYDNNPFRLDGFLGIGSWSGFHRYERDIRSLSSLKILANDQLVYERSGINFTFEGGNLVWPPFNGVESIQDGSAFVQLMRKDCPTTQK